MPAELAANAFKELSLKGLLNEKKSYKHKEAIEYSLHHKLLFPAIFELFEPQNHTLLKNIRSLFKQRTRCKQAKTCCVRTNWDN